MKSRRTRKGAELVQAIRRIPIDELREMSCGFPEGNARLGYRSVVSGEKKNCTKGSNSMDTPWPQTQSEHLLTAAEVAEMLRVSPSWIREKTRERALIRDTDPLPHVRLGKYVRFRWTDVSLWLDRQSTRKAESR